jgi:lycopene cyclase domain-containing protein
LKPNTYLLVDFLTVFVCFIFSFHKKIGFNKEFPAFIKSAGIVGFVFILWDIWFTKMGVWWFDFKYTLGISLFRLPLEEWLFFLCIPFSCIFTYYCFEKFFDLSRFRKYDRWIVFCGSILSILVVFFYHDRWYPFITAMITFASLLSLFYLAKVEWIGGASFVFLILLLGFFPVNAVLTGTGLDSPIVNYNPHQIIGRRMFTIPVEDALYGYTEFLLTLYFFKWFQKRSLKPLD